MERLRLGRVQNHETPKLPLPLMLVRPDAKKGSLPNLVIIGSMKCGTTSLHYYLGLHPDISMSLEKELCFFVKELNWNRGIDWYRSWFTERASIRGEASTDYTLYPVYRDVPARMHGLIPEARLIYMVRDPVERIVSHYVHFVTNHREHRPLQEAVLGWPEMYVDRSKYYLQLQQYLEFFSPSQILIVQQEDLLRRRTDTLSKIFRFLDVEPVTRDPRFRWERHRTKRRRRKSVLGVRLAATVPMRRLKLLPRHLRWPIEDFIYWPFSHAVERPMVGDRLFRELSDMLRDDVEQLRAYTGEAFANWKI